MLISREKLEKLKFFRVHLDVENHSLDSEFGLSITVQRYSPSELTITRVLSYRVMKLKKVMNYTDK